LGSNQLNHNTQPAEFRDLVLFLHNRYRTTGGEERAAEELLWLVRDRMGEPAELVARSSSSLSRGEAAAALLRGGFNTREVASAVRLSGARVVHAHNLQPAFGWRALAAARAAGARVVLHLHQYRMVCAIGVCYTRGADCTRCRGRRTLPGVLLNCRGSLGEAVTYGASLALWQRRLAEQADAVIVPSRFALERLRELQAPLDSERVHVLAPPLRALDQPPRPPAGGGYALVASRLSPEKGVDVAIEACSRLRIPLLIAGDGPERQALSAKARGADARLLGRVSEQELQRLRAGAAIALVPSRSAETFGLAAAEAMASGLPVAASRVGALPELVPDEALAVAGDAESLAAAVARQLADAGASQRGRERVAALCAPDLVAGKLAAIYDGLAAAAQAA
jgi:glycosyltransferase involved in cell wall biosynthesis